MKKKVTAKAAGKKKLRKLRRNEVIRAGDMYEWPRGTWKKCTCFGMRVAIAFSEGIHAYRPLRKEKD